ncbi:MAG: DUF2357 domain-containing protein [Paludibacteraceae bacterium]|nr:DUF2357 domain-containing protein [Paludibacteraceae bacterium]
MIADDKPETQIRKKAIFGQTTEGVEFRRNSQSDEDWVTEDETNDWDAFFFENTDYPLHAIPNSHDVKLKGLVIGKENILHVAAEDGIIFGAINYRNQVGRTQIQVDYEKNGEPLSLVFTTEVLSYKMDYRTDMRSVIRNIEEEFAMLSYSYLKKTYLTFCTSNNESPDLIWWQIFRDCFRKITDAARLIIGNPKRRLQTMVRYERAERMPYMPVDLENEYEEFKDNPAHLYRMEEMYLSKDTIENRFLKYALASILDRFNRVRRNVEQVLKADNIGMSVEIKAMGEELNILANDSFFRGIGTFRGFTQDSLVMKQAAGYRDVYENWVILQCGYDLQDGVMQLEVKDISELYEIWCFIMVKRMVQHILRNKASLKGNETKVEGNFIKTLLQGSKSEVIFIENEHPDVQLASLMYNATTDDEEQLKDESVMNQNTDIANTTSKTTEQRPDIVLRLSKTADSIQYTYLFDAKYRIRDTRVKNVDVPPVDAINQLHRYRDAIYYNQSTDERLKREVIGGYVLYPGNMTKNEFVGSYYQRSVDEVNIGAFPLKPGGHWQKMYDEDGKCNDLLLDATSPEDVLYHQIKTWLEDDKPAETLLERAIPQRGLRYTTKGKQVYIGYVKAENPDIELFRTNQAKTYYSGNIDFDDVDIQTLAYLLPIVAGKVQGVYEIESVNFRKLSKIRPLKQGESDNLRIVFALGKFEPFVKSPIPTQNKLHNNEVCTLEEAKKKILELTTK